VAPSSARSVNPPGRVARAGEERIEHRDQLVSDELVDDAIVLEDRFGGGVVEAIHELVEICRGHAFGKCS
jgi:hypothetical protein